jgi:hypothetical protein
MDDKWKRVGRILPRSVYYADGSRTVQLRRRPELLRRSSSLAKDHWTAWKNRPRSAVARYSGTASSSLKLLVKAFWRE